MKRLFTLVFLFSAISSFAQMTYLGQIGSSSYYVSDNTMTWTAASALCASSGGSMVAIDSQNESDDLNLLLGNSASPPFGPNAHWIGLIDGNTTWENGDPLTFTNYDASYGQVNGQYMYIQTNGKWDNSPNNGSEGPAGGIYAIMEVSNTCIQVAGFTSLGTIGDCCYYVSDNTMSWTNANALCISSGGNMTALNSQAESDSLNLLLGNTPNPPYGPNFHWLGLVDGSSSWQNGDPLTFTNYDAT